MIIVINGTLGAGQKQVAKHLVARLTNGALVEGETSPMGALREQGIFDFVLPGVFPTWSGLRRLRRELAPLDSTSYAFRLTCEESTLADEALELQRRQERAASEGDVGFPVPPVGPEQSARFIWDDVREPVALEPWSADWRAAFERERRAIRHALGDRALVLEHVGSTAVEGLTAKPIIDIVLAVPSLVRTADYLPALRELGHHFLDYPTNVDRYFFKKGRPRTHHLHVGETGSRELMDSVRFRDLLRVRPDLRERYAVLKRELEHRFGEDRARFSEGKGAFIATALAREST